MAQEADGCETRCITLPLVEEVVAAGSRFTELHDGNSGTTCAWSFAARGYAATLRLHQEGRSGISFEPGLPFAYQVPAGAVARFCRSLVVSGVVDGS